MTYYRVRKEYDNKPLFKYKEKNGFSYWINDGGILIGNELYTAKEREKLAVKDCCFEKVEINKNRTYFFFGARFSLDD